MYEVNVCIQGVHAHTGEQLRTRVASEEWALVMARSSTYKSTALSSGRLVVYANPKSMSTLWLGRAGEMIQEMQHCTIPPWGRAPAAGPPPG
jgi:hypothetical protein